jgi:hypothetical protein
MTRNESSISYWCYVIYRPAKNQIINLLRIIYNTLVLLIKIESKDETKPGESTATAGQDVALTQLKDAAIAPLWPTSAACLVSHVRHWLMSHPQEAMWSAKRFNPTPQFD